MIGSNYIFIDVPKTGTTAIVNYLLANTTVSPVAGAVTTATRALTMGPVHSHIPLSSYIDILGRQVVKDAYVFTVVRNPYARLVSIWKYYNKLKTKYHEIDPGTPTCKDDPHRRDALKYLERSPCFDSYIEDILRYDPPSLNSTRRVIYDRQFPYCCVFLKSQFALLNPGGSSPIHGGEYFDRVISFENMDAGWRLVCEEMGWKHRELEKVNVSGGPKWQSFYSKKQLESLRPLIMPDLHIWDSLKK